MASLVPVNEGVPAGDRSSRCEGAASRRKRKRKANEKSSRISGSGSRPLVPSVPSSPVLASSGDDGDGIAGGGTITTKRMVPQRECRNLYTSLCTYRCATRGLCVPCAYKVGTFDVALDADFTRRVPNARPENCPRFGVQRSETAAAATTTTTTTTTTTRSREQDGGGGGVVMGYRRGMSVLTVGDGDLTFSLAIARLILTADDAADEQTSAERRSAPKKGSSSRSRLVATSYESRDCLLGVYPGIEDTIRQLEALGATVCYEVDATRLVETLPDSVLYGGQALAQGGEKKHADGSAAATGEPAVVTAQKFHRIVWNFPCSAVSSGQDGQNDAMEANKRLVREFVRNATHALLDDEGGEIHMTHKTKPPFNQWQMESVALEGLLGTAASSSTDGKVEAYSGARRRRMLEYKGRVVFDRCTVRPYTPRKALDKKSFTCHDAVVFVFGWARAGVPVVDHAGGQTHKFPPTIPPPTLDNDNDDETSKDDAKDDTIVPVTKEMLLELRNIHLLNATEPKTPGGKGKRRRRNEKRRAKMQP